jgi:hypothetical protein
VPGRDFAVVALSNAGPDGIPCNQAIVRWALRTYLGLTDRDPGVDLAGRLFRRVPAAAG